MIDITQIVVILIGLMAAVVTAVIIPWAKSKVSADKWYQLTNIATVAVMAAEQLYKSGQGKEKLAYALSLVEKELAKRNIAFDSNVIIATIEALVYREINSYKFPYSAAEN